MFPFRVRYDRKLGYHVPQFPEQCEWQCMHSDDVREHLSYTGYLTWLARKARTRDPRQCRGCGRWGIFDYRALMAGAR